MCISESFTFFPERRYASDSMNEVMENDQQVPVRYCATGGWCQNRWNASGPAGFSTPAKSRTALPGTETARASGATTISVSANSPACKRAPGFGTSISTHSERFDRSNAGLIRDTAPSSGAARPSM